MRTTLDIDDDILSAARELARADGKTIGEVISDLARQALTTPTPALGETGQEALSKWPTFPSRAGGRVVTLEIVQKVQEEIDLEDAMPFDHATGKVGTLDDQQPQKSKARRPRRKD